MSTCTRQKATIDDKVSIFFRKERIKKNHLLSIYFIFVGFTGIGDLSCLPEFTYAQGALAYE